ncbi:MAG: thiamine pyrophosphate-dependent dehydrogenase E1 component subunit alpha [Dehalococcoidia bacterium]
MDISRDRLLEMYERMATIRHFEERVRQLFREGNLPGFVHLYAGQEAMAVGVCTHLRDDDYIVSTHRGHGHCIAKGVDVRAMMAELYGRASGSCKGKGGSMHIADLDKGMLGANGIVGAGAPLACGAGLTSKVNGSGQVAVCFFGDGAAEQGTIHESMNLAAIWKLPVVFVCENNGYAESTPVGYHCAARDIADRAIAYDMPAAAVDGADLFAVYEATGEAVERARRGEGPSLIECRGFRFYGHFEGDAVTYRTPEEEAAYRQRDPTVRFRLWLVEHNAASDDQLAAIDGSVQQLIDEAMAFAEASPWPQPQETLQDVYVSYP